MLVKNLITRDKIRQDLEQIDRQKHEQSPGHWEFQAQESFYSNDFEMALYYINKVIDLNPSQFVYFKRAQIYYHLHEYDLAITDLDTAIQLDEDYENAILLKEFIIEKKKYTMDPYS
jgi:tetratricopeptide (TPR) repeat protein